MYLCDININFYRNVVNNAVSSVYDKRALQQIVSNLITTSTMEIPFKEWEGSGLVNLLGQACSNLTASVIVEQIRILLEKYIRYIEVQDIIYQIDYDNQAYQITIYYTIVNTTEVLEQTLILTTTL